MNIVGGGGVKRWRVNHHVKGGVNYRNVNGLNITLMKYI